MNRELIILNQNWGNKYRNPFQGEFTFFKNIPYGLNERNRLDILLPNQNKLEGVVIFFHGGAFLLVLKKIYMKENNKKLFHLYLMKILQL